MAVVNTKKGCYGINLQQPLKAYMFKILGCSGGHVHKLFALWRGEDVHWEV